MNKGGFSWKRLAGVSRAKSRISRATGVPLTKSGRQRKVGKMVTGGGCLVMLLAMGFAGLAGAVLTVSLFLVVIAPPVGAMENNAPRFSQRLAQCGVAAYTRVEEPGPEIPGLAERWVPQGLVGLGDGRFLTSAYRYELIRGTFTSRGETRVSILSADVDPVHVYLYRRGERFQGHVGGVAVHGDTILVADGRSVYRAKTPTDETEIELKRAFRTRLILASCIAVDADGRIWLGEHRRRGHNDIPEHTYEDSNGVRNYALIGIYSEAGDLKAVLTVRQKLQGIAFHDDVVVLSLSYGRRNRSVLAFFRNPLIHQEPAGRHSLSHANDEATVPLYHLDSKIGEFRIDPMSEEIWLDPETLDLWVNFESGSTKFKTHPLRFPPIRVPFRVKGRINRHLVRYSLPTSTDL